MDKSRVKFFGSEADVVDLRKTLLDAGFDELKEDNIVKAHDPSEFAPLFAVTFLVVVAKLAPCLNTWLQGKNKRCVARDGSGFFARGYSVEETIRLAEATDRMDIADDIEPPPTEDGRPEIGYHTTMKRPAKEPPQNEQPEQ